MTNKIKTNPTINSKLNSKLISNTTPTGTPTLTKSQLQLRLSLLKFNKFLKYLDFSLFIVFFSFFIWFITKIDNNCINTICTTKWLDLSNYGIMWAVYQDTFFSFFVKFVMPVFTTLGLLRVALTFFVNKKEGALEVFFYLGILIFGYSYILISQYASEFLYIYAPSNTVHPESGQVSSLLFLLIIGSLILFHDKKNWDRASFFTKIRLIFYCVLIVFCVININFGIVFFLVFTPFLMLIDLHKRNHIHYNHPKWMSEDV